ncbi:MAG: BON domain-containing protein [Candidatus Sulfotelmatobacter sp.]
MIKSVLKTALAATLFCSLAGWAQDQSMQQGSSAPDNTKMNQRDRSGAEPTADQQKENTSDRELTRQVRRALVQDKSLSTYGHNVKIIAQNGTVTLKGPVKSEEEKTTIEQKAAQAAGGADKIHSELEVKSDSGKPSANQ